MIPTSVYALCHLINPEFNIESGDPTATMVTISMATRIYNAMTTPQVLQMMALQLDNVNKEATDRSQRQHARELIDMLISEAAGQYGA